MKRRILACASLLFLLPAAHADSLADENARLRQQLQELQTRNAALERACPTAAQPPVAAPPTAAAAPAAAVAAAPAVAAAAAPGAAPAPVPAEAVVHKSPQIFAPTPAPAPAPAAASASADAPASPPDYASTGCDRSFWSGPVKGKWQSPKAWKALHPGMSQSEVEALLGIEHYNLVEPNSPALHWQYGRCNSGWDGEVVFLNGVVKSYSAP